MIQQINLYQAGVFEKKEPLPANTMLVAAGAALALLLLIYAIAQWQTLRLSHHLAELRAQQTRAAQRLAELHGQYLPKGKSRLLEQEIDRLRAGRDARLPLLDLLAAKPFGNTTGFSPHLEGLARQSVEGMWLRRIVLGAGGAKVTLEGRTLRPELVPRYLQQLAREEVFAGLEFTRLQLTRADDRPGYVDFLLETAPEAGP